MKKKIRVFALLMVLITVMSTFMTPQNIRAASADGNAIVEIARRYIGKVPYVWGGNVIDGNNVGADCSGFICAIYDKFGYNLWGNRTALRNCGTNLGTDLSLAQPGDIIWFTGHVGIYSGVNSSGQHMVVHETGGSYQNVVETPISWVRAELKGIIRIPGVTIGGNTTPIPVTASWSEYPAQFSVGETNATLSKTISLSGASINSVTTVGIELYNYDGSVLLASKSEKPYPSNGVINMWYNVNSELGVYLTPAGKYQYVFFATLSDGTQFRSEVCTITTQGIHVHSDEYKGVEAAHPHRSIMSCAYCGEVYHVGGSANFTEVTLPAVSATCSSTGLTAGTKCSVCNEVIVAQQTVPAKSHNYVATVTKKPTSTSTGVKTYKCSGCGDTYTETIAKLAVLKSAYLEVLEHTDTTVTIGITATTDSTATSLEYRWTVYDCASNEAVYSTTWSADNKKLIWDAVGFGDYKFVGEVRVANNTSSKLSAEKTVTHHPKIIGKCQMPWWGEGGGFLIGVETYENPNQSYYYELLVLDCTLLAEGKDAWVWTTNKCRVSSGNAFWAVWQPQYGYYWTLFRVYDANGNMIDQACYPFVNAY